MDQPPKQRTHSQAPSRRQRKRGVIGVMFRGPKLLVIRRSLTVNAPGKLCLPGGGIEAGESETDALVREMQEELSIQVTPIQLCWRSVTPWGTRLAWWLAEFPDTVDPIPNPDEVAEVHWMTAEEILVAKNMLPSLPDFVHKWQSGELDLT